jgi:hypothetical protein
MMTYEEIYKLVKEQATPIDFDVLIQTGALEKHGSWYKIQKKSKVPSHVLQKISSVRITTINGSVKSTLVKFRSSKSAEKLLAKMEKLKI